MGIISQKLRDSARGQECTLRTPYCNGDRETTVLCHAPSEVEGMGNKSHDLWAAFGCSACHEALDQHKSMCFVTNSRLWEYFYWLNGIARTQAYWLENGLITIPGTGKRRPKKKANMPSRKMESKTTWIAECPRCGHHYETNVVGTGQATFRPSPIFCGECPPNIHMLKWKKQPKIPSRPFKSRDRW